MSAALARLWTLISHTGISHARTERERREIIDLNKGLFLLLLIQVFSFASHLANGLQRSALMTGVFVAGLFMLRILLWKGHVNAAKIASIILINYNTITMAVFLGPQTRVIDFLLLTALLPLYYFEIHNRKLIFWGIAVSVVPFALYHFITPYIALYGVPVSEQLIVSQTTEPVKLLSLVALLYLIYNKNLRYEREVTEKETELINQKELYERLLEQIPIDIVTFDKDLRYTYVNSMAMADGEMRKWIIGKTNAEYFEHRKLDKSTAQSRESILHQALEQEKPVQMEEVMTDRHGKTKHTLKGAAPIYNSQGQLLCLVGYSLDITSIKDAEVTLKMYAAELERKNEDLKHFIHATSHDLKSPLRNIASYLQLLQKRNTGKLDDDSLSMISHTIKSVKHLNQLITDIYHYSVADQNDKPAEVTDLNKVVDDILKRMAATINDRQAQITHHRMPLIEAAPSHMAMLLNNLIENALKYNNATPPVVNIGFTETAQEYIFSVADNGIGIAPRHTKQIFEIFKRLHTSEEYEGTGVGLAICNKIVQNYGGRMWVESEQGTGSVFYFSLSRQQVKIKPTTAFKLDGYNGLAKAS